MFSQASYQVGINGNFPPPAMNYMAYLQDVRWAFLLSGTNAISAIPYNSGDNGISWPSSFPGPTSDTNPNGTALYCMMVYDSRFNTRKDGNFAAKLTVAYVSTVASLTIPGQTVTAGPNYTYTISLIDFDWATLTWGSPYAPFDVINLYYSGTSPGQLWMTSLPNGNIVIVYGTNEIVVGNLSPAPDCQLWITEWNGASWSTPIEIDGRETTQIGGLLITNSGTGYANFDSITLSGPGTQILVGTDGSGHVNNYEGVPINLSGYAVGDALTQVATSGSGAGATFSVYSLGWTFGDTGNFGQFLLTDDLNNAYLMWLEGFSGGLAQSAPLDCTAATPIIGTVTSSGMTNVSTGNVSLVNAILDDGLILIPDPSGTVIYIGTIPTIINLASSIVWITQTASSYPTPATPVFLETSPISIYYTSQKFGPLPYNVNIIYNNLGVWQTPPSIDSQGVGTNTVWNMVAFPPPVGTGLADAYQFFSMQVNPNPLLGGFNITMGGLDSMGEYFTMDFLTSITVPPTAVSPSVLYLARC